MWIYGAAENAATKSLQIISSIPMKTTKRMFGHSIITNEMNLETDNDLEGNVISINFITQIKL